MTRLVLDTSAYSHFRRGDDAVISLVTAASWIGMTATVLGELRAGFGPGRRRARNEDDLASFCQSRWFTYSMWMTMLRRSMPRSSSRFVPQERHCRPMTSGSLRWLRARAFTS